MKGRNRLKKVIFIPIQLGFCVAVLVTFSLLTIRSNKDNHYE